MRKKFGSWQQLTTKIIHKNPFFSVTEDTVLRPDGTDGTFWKVVQPVGGVMIVPVDDRQNVQLIGLHRYANDTYSLEVPGGRVDDNDPLAAAKLELAEEAGLSAKHWKQLSSTYPAKGLLKEVNYMFLATGLSPTGHNEQAEEGIEETRSVPFEQLWDMIETGEITDGQTITALTLAAIELGLIR